LLVRRRRYRKYCRPDSEMIERCKCSSSVLEGDPDQPLVTVVFTTETHVLSILELPPHKTPQRITNPEARHRVGVAVDLARKKLGACERQERRKNDLPARPARLDENIEHDQKDPRRQRNE